MGLGRYLRDRAAAICVTLLSVLLVDVVLDGSGMGRDAIVLLDLLLLGAAVARVALDYVRRRRFWSDLAAATSGEDESPLNAVELVGEPSFVEGEIAWDAIEAVSREGRVEADAARDESNEYREYVEAWVHEVKTPIAAARIITDSNPGQVSSSLARELGRIDGYVDQALYYARSATLDRDYVIREVRLRDIVTDAVRGHARSLIDGGVRVEVQGLDVTVFADAKWMSFVLGQLVENAVKYRAAAPCLAFSARVRGRGTADECVELAVEDNGIGIPAEDLPRVFEMGFVGQNGRLEGQTKSTGLGLYLVKRLCDKMGVGVRMESEQGSFTRATLTFPTNLTQVV